MPEEPVNPFAPQPQPQAPPSQYGGLASLTPQEGQLEPNLETGSFYSLSPEVLQMMWAPQVAPPQAQQLPY